MSTGSRIDLGVILGADGAGTGTFYVEGTGGQQTHGTQQTLSNGSAISSTEIDVMERPLFQLAFQVRAQFANATSYTVAFFGRQGDTNNASIFGASQIAPIYVDRLDGLGITTAVSHTINASDGADQTIIFSTSNHTSLDKVLVEVTPAGTGLTSSDSIYIRARQ